MRTKLFVIFATLVLLLMAGCVSEQEEKPMGDIKVVTKDDKSAVVVEEKTLYLVDVRIFCRSGIRVDIKSKGTFLRHVKYTGSWVEYSAKVKSTGIDISREEFGSFEDSAYLETDGKSKVFIKSPRLGDLDIDSCKVFAIYASVRPSTPFVLRVKDSPFERRADYVFPSEIKYVKEGDTRWWRLVEQNLSRVAYLPPKEPTDEELVFPEFKLDTMSFDSDFRENPDVDMFAWTLQNMYIEYPPPSARMMSFLR